MELKSKNYTNVYKTLDNYHPFFTEYKSVELTKAILEQTQTISIGGILSTGFIPICEDEKQFEQIVIDNFFFIRKMVKDNVYFYKYFMKDKSDLNLIWNCHNSGVFLSEKLEFFQAIKKIYKNNVKEVKWKRENMK
jgi:hypothetical protein